MATGQESNPTPRTNPRASASASSASKPPSPASAVSPIPAASPSLSASEQPEARLETLVRHASLALLFETFWRAIIPPFLVAGAFLALSFAGLWLILPSGGRLLGFLVFAAAFLAAAMPLLKMRWPTRAQALARIERSSGLPHQPASVLSDTLANAGPDPATQALWAVHRRRASEAIARMRAGWPQPRVVERDPYALRALVLVGLVAAAFVAGPQKYARVAAAFDWGFSTPTLLATRLDAWIDPPTYTGRAPVLLTGNEHPGSKFEVPAGSTLIVRSSGWGTGFDISGAASEIEPEASEEKGKTGEKPAARQERALPAGDEREKRYRLNGKVSLALQQGGRSRGSYEIDVIPDKPPSITFIEAPRYNRRGSMTLGYKISDDYGVAQAQALLSNPHLDGETAPIRSLVEPPQIALALPTAPGGLGDAETTIDLSDHPWAGARVTMVLDAQDDGGNEGRSPPLELILPQKPFTNPLAGALAEQRRILVMTPSNRSNVLMALESLMIAPEIFDTGFSPYLGLRVAADRLQDAKTDADLIAVADLLWEMALRIENGGLPDAERELRAAEQQLRDAIARHAAPEEIEKQAQALQQAMDKFLSELARQDAQDGQRPRTGGGQAQTISSKELQAMIDQMREAAKSGDQAKARQMLDRLRGILDNLKIGRRAKPDPRAAEANRSIDALNKMSREQQDLRDETYQSEDRDLPSLEDQLAGPRQRGQQANPQAQNQNTEQKLQDRQRHLREKLGEVQKRLKQTGQGEKSLDEAEKAMREAEQALGEGEDGRGEAADAQGRALQAMREGAEKLAENLANGSPDQGDGEGEGEGTAKGQAQQGEDDDSPGHPAQADAFDPLGRPAAGSPVFNPGSQFNPLGVPAAQRAQQILEELRRRLSDPQRPREETDYLERLLRPF